jgi:hypothetical protein
MTFIFKVQAVTRFQTASECRVLVGVLLCEESVGVIPAAFFAP